MGISYRLKPKIFQIYKTEKGVIVNEGTRNQLEVKLRKMLDQFYLAKAKEKQPIRQTGTGNIIRRREGESEKRFSRNI